MRKYAKTDRNVIKISVYLRHIAQTKQFRLQRKGASQETLADAEVLFVRFV